MAGYFLIRGHRRRRNLLKQAVAQLQGASPWFFSRVHVFSREGREFRVWFEEYEQSFSLYLKVAVMGSPGFVFIATQTSAFNLDALGMKLVGHPGSDRVIIKSSKPDEAGRFFQDESRVQALEDLFLAGYEQVRTDRKTVTAVLGSPRDDAYSAERLEQTAARLARLV